MINWIKFTKEMPHLDNHFISCDCSDTIVICAKDENPHSLRIGYLNKNKNSDIIYFQCNSGETYSKETLLDPAGKNQWVYFKDLKTI